MKKKQNTLRTATAAMGLGLMMGLSIPASAEELNQDDSGVYEDQNYADVPEETAEVCTESYDYQESVTAEFV